MQDHGQELSPPVGGKHFARGVPAHLRLLPHANGNTGWGLARRVSGAEGARWTATGISYPPFGGHRLASFPIIILSVAVRTCRPVVESGRGCNAPSADGFLAMTEEQTTAVVQRYLVSLGGGFSR